MNNEAIALPSIPVMPGAREAFPTMNVVTPFAHKATAESPSAIMPLPKIAEEIELPKPSKLPEKKIQKIQQKFEKAVPAKKPAPAVKAKTVAKPAAKSAKKAPTKAKAPAKKPAAKAKKK